MPTGRRVWSISYMMMGGGAWDGKIDSRVFIEVVWLQCDV